MNIATTLDARAAATPGQAALFDPIGRGADGALYDEVSYDTLAADARRMAAGLVDAGLRSGDRVAIMVPPSRAFFTLTFALFRLGAVPVFIDPGMGALSLKRCLAEAAPAGFVGTAKAHAARLLLGWERGKLRHVFHLGDAGRLAPDARPIPRTAREEALHGAAPDATAAILFTSGSTGAPKGAVYRHAHFLAQIALLRTVYGIEPGERDLCTFPLFALFAPALGMTAVVPEMDFTRPARVDPEKIFAAIERFQVTNLFGSPALLRRVGQAGSARGRTLPSLRRVLSAGAPVPAKTLAAFAGLLAGDAEVHTPYGATEALPVATIGSREVLGETAKLTAAGGGICVGRPVPGIDVRIIAIEDGSVRRWRDALALPTGHIGEIVVAGPQVTTAYFARPEADALAKIADPGGLGVRHRMGDLGYFDALGRLWFCGRKSHRVATAGGELYTIPCEAVFNKHAQVYRSALVGRGRCAPLTPVICVETEKRLSRRDQTRVRIELLELARSHAGTTGIREVRFFRSLPVDTRHNAKIFREKLKAIVDREVQACGSS